jgi:hypothetical protein
MLGNHQRFAIINFMKNTLTKMKNHWFITIAIVLGLLVASEMAFLIFLYSLKQETKALVKDTAGLAVNAEKLAHDAKSLAHDTHDVVKDVHNTYESTNSIDTDTTN